MLMIAFKSIHSRFIAVLLPLFIVSFLLLTVMTYYMASEALMREEITISKCIADEMAVRIQLGVTNVQLPLKMAGTREAVLSGDEEQILPVLLQLKKLHPVITQTFFLHPDGMMLRADQKHLDRHTREYFQKVAATHEPYISKPFMGETTQKMQTMVLQPILSGDTLVGILMAAVYIDDLAQMTTGSDLHFSGISYLIGEDGMVIGCDKDKASVGKLSLRKTPEDGTVIDPKLVTAWQDAVNSGEASFTYYTMPNGEERLAAIAPFALAGNTWAVISTASADEVRGPVRHLMLVMSVVFLVVLMLSVFAILHFAESITKPLEHIAGAFRQMTGSEDANAEEMSARQDEIGILSTGVEKMRLLSDQKQHYEHQASSDELTGLLNRFGFKRYFARMVQDHLGCHAALIFADLDHLKHINDGIGHAAGDDAIQTVANLLRKASESNYVIGRIGGDEFVVFYCVREGSAKAKETVARIRELSEAYNASSGKPYYVELSLGLIEFDCAEDTDLSSLMQEADRLLYEAKKVRRETALRDVHDLPEQKQ